MRLVSSPATMGLKGVSRVGKADIWQQRGLILKMNVCPVKAGNMEMEREQAYAENAPPEHTGLRSQPPHAHAVPQEPITQIEVVHQSLPVLNALQVSMVHPKAPRCH